MRTVFDLLVQREILCARFNFSEESSKFSCKMIEPGIVSYLNTPEKDVILLRKETIDRCIATAMANPVTIGHVDPTEPVSDDLRKGSVSAVRYNAEDGWYYVDGDVASADAKSLIKRGHKPSCAYIEKTVVRNNTGQKYHGFHYDTEITEIEFHHLAIVPKGRYEDAVFRLNSIPAMNLFKLIISGFKTDKGAPEEKTVDIPSDTMVELGDGKSARLNEMGKAWMDMTAQAATGDEIDIPAAGELPACKVKREDLVSCYQTSRTNDAAAKKAQGQKVADDPEAVRANAAAETARVNAAAGKQAFDTLQGARFKTTAGESYSTSSGSLKEKCERGAKRY